MLSLNQSLTTHMLVYFYFGRQTKKAKWERMKKRLNKKDARLEHNCLGSLQQFHILWHSIYMKKKKIILLLLLSCFEKSKLMFFHPSTELNATTSKTNTATPSIPTTIRIEAAWKHQTNNNFRRKFIQNRLYVLQLLKEK